VAETVRVIESADLFVEGLPADAAQDVKRALTLPNPKYAEAERFGRWTGNLPRTLNFYEDLGDGALAVPRGYYRALRQIVERHGLEFELDVQSSWPPPVDFDSSVVLTAAQEAAVELILAKRMGQLVAPAGAGKTIMALEIVARRQQAALWLTHTRELAHQARDRAAEFLGLDPGEIGMLGDGKYQIGERLTIGMVQTLARRVPDELLDRIGHLVVDECHHTPAQQMGSVVSQIPARYVLGLSATPYRRDKLDPVIRLYLGPVAATIDKAYLPERLLTPSVRKIDTGIRPAGDSFTALVSDLVVNPERNQLLIGTIAAAANAGRRVLVLSERVEHVETLTALLTRTGQPAAALHGGLAREERAVVRSKVERGAVSIVVATSQLVGEGWDCPPLDTLALATPISYRGRLVQYVGRVSRTAPGKTQAVVLDFCDDHPMLWASWAKRRDVYAAAGNAVHKAAA